MSHSRAPSDNGSSSSVRPGGPIEAALEAQAHLSIQKQMYFIGKLYDAMNRATQFAVDYIVSEEGRESTLSLNPASLSEKIYSKLAEDDVLRKHVIYSAAEIDTVTGDIDGQLQTVIRTLTQTRIDTLDALTSATFVPRPEASVDMLVHVSENRGMEIPGSASVHTQQSPTDLSAFANDQYSNVTQKKKTSIYNKDRAAAQKKKL